MIKIEFKEAQQLVSYLTDEFVNVKDMFPPVGYAPKSISISKITFGCPSELVPDRSEILKQLGISPQEDELFQGQYKNV